METEAGDESKETDVDGAEEDFDPLSQWHPNNPYDVRVDLPDILSESLF